MMGDALTHTHTHTHTDTHTHTLIFVSLNAEMATSPLPYLLEIALRIFL